MPELVVRGLLVTEAQVVRDRAAEEVRPLGDEADPAPQAFQRLLSHVHAIDQDRASAHVEESRYEVEQRGLAGSRAADDCGRLSGLQVEHEVLQHRLPAPTR